MSFKKAIRDKIPVALGAYHFLWAWTSSRLRGKPSRKIFVIGVTGTKGKTSTLELINAILEAAGKKTAISSSLRIKLGDESRKNRLGNTMPGRGFLQKFLARAVRAGCGYALVEVSSEGVVAHRHEFIDWNMAVLTNLMPEHIESHGSFENYRAAKLEFLKYALVRGAKVFLNADDPNFPFFNDALAKAKTEAFSARSDDLRRYLPRESPVRQAQGAGVLPLEAKLLFSDFNKSNIACAIAVANDLGIGDATVQQAIASFRGVPGRLNVLRVDDRVAIIDYAHTPDSLEGVYRSVKPQPSAAYQDPKLICVLGAAGGGRDTWKRPEFGKIAAKYCDQIFLTEEDPYDEDPKAIAAQILSGIDAANFPRTRLIEVSDRREAIKAAVRMMRPGDIVIGTGKGSEDWIHYAKGKKMPWNEKEEFERALLARKTEAVTPKEEAPHAVPSGDPGAADAGPLDLPWM